MTTGNEYRFAILNKADVEVTNAPDSIVLLLTHTSRTELEIHDANAQRLLNIRRTRCQPYARFVMTRDGHEVGTVVCKNLFRTRYQIEFSDKKTWMFHMPLFKTYFTAISGEADTVKIRMLKENIWALLFGIGKDSQELLGALALIFRSRWTSS